MNGVIDMLAIAKLIQSAVAWLASPTGLLVVGMVLAALVRMGIIPQSVSDLIREILTSIGGLVVKSSSAMMNFALPVDDSVFSRSDVAAMQQQAKSLRRAGKCPSEIKASLTPIVDAALGITETTPPKV